MMTTHHLHHLDMGAVAMVAEDHTGIQGNHRIPQTIHPRIGEEVVGINLILLHLRILILCMGRLRITVRHQTIRILHHHLIMARLKITMFRCMVVTTPLTHLTTIEEVLLHHCQDLITQVCQCIHLIWEGRRHPIRTAIPLGWKKKPY